MERHACGAMRFALDSGPGKARFILSLSKGRNDAK
jgi:hypothetical protein